MDRINKASSPFLIWGLAAGLFLVGCGQSAKPIPVLQVGDKAADFSLPDSSGHFMKLSDVQPNTYLILTFYRGAWCPTCVDQLIDLKKDFLKFGDAHAALAAVSVDTVDDSAAFNGQWRFPFPLLSDSQFHLIDAYGARDPKGGEKKEDISHVGVVIIDPQKVVRYKYIGTGAWDRPDDDEILFNLQKIQAAGNYKPGGAL